MKINKILLVLIFTMFLSTATFAQNQQIQVLVDGVRLHTDVAPKTVNNRTLLPMRAIFEAMGAEVKWDAKNNTAIGVRGNDTIKLKIGNRTATINGKTVMIDVPATAVNGRTLVPTRFIAESLGAEVNWDPATRAVIISTQQYLNNLSVTDEFYNINWLDYMGKNKYEVIESLGYDYHEDDYELSDYIEYDNSPLIFLDDYDDVRMLGIGMDIMINNKNIKRSMTFNEIESILGKAQGREFSDYEGGYELTYNMSYNRYVFSSENKSGKNWILFIKDTRGE